MIHEEESIRKRNLLKSPLLGGRKKLSWDIVKLNFSIKANASTQLKPIQHTLFFSNLSLAFSKLLLLVKNWKKSELIRISYHKAISAPLGQFLIDFDPKPNESLRFRCIVTGPDPTNCFLLFLRQKRPLGQWKAKDALIMKL